MEIRKMRMVRMPNRYGEEEFRRMKPDVSAGIYVTLSVEAQWILIAQKQKMKEAENINNTKVNALKRVARMNQRATSFAKLVANLPDKMMTSEDPSTPLLLQFLLSLSTDIIKDSYQNLGGNMGEFPDLKKRTVAAAIVWKWSERIWVMGRDTRVSWKCIVLSHLANWHNWSINYT